MRGVDPNCPTKRPGAHGRPYFPLFPGRQEDQRNRGPGDLGQIRYICSRRLNLGLFQKDINVAWDLAPHDISIVLHLLGEFPESVNCSGSAHVTPGIEDVTSMCLQFGHDRSAIIHSSWLDPRKVREMTIVGSKRMLVYDDVAQQEKVRIFDARVERPPHYDTFAEFHYAYHYGDTYAPYLKLEEPLKSECQHFLDCIRESKIPLSSGLRGLELVKILEACTASLHQGGSRIPFVHHEEPRRVRAALHPRPAEDNGTPKADKKNPPPTARPSAALPAVTA